MFTGIVEEIGTIENIKKGTASAVLTIRAKKVMSDVHVGDSICVNGICLTVTEFTGSTFSVDVMHETLNRTSLQTLGRGSHVNLERAMQMNGRFGGHIVAGHIDGTGKIVQKKRDDNAVWYTVQTEPSITKYIVEKGSITIDGISLTVASVNNDHFSVSAIPQTEKETILSEKNIGDLVNLETDMIGKYVEKFLNKDNPEEKQSNGITMDFLIQNGF